MIIPGDVPDLVVGEVEPLEGGVAPEGAEGDVADLVVGEVEEREARRLSMRKLTSVTWFSWLCARYSFSTCKWGCSFASTDVN